jgi:hypothetical protein|nr:MAG TPA: hypothetical protein [Caudoviricetes sp.]
MNRHLIRACATNTVSALIDNRGVLYTCDFRGRRQAVAQIRLRAVAVNPRNLDARLQAEAILRAHKFLGIVLPVIFECELDD